MAKGKNSGKRLTKKRLVEMLSTLFQTNPNETFSFKQIFKQLHLTNHPEKMLAIDIMEAMAWDDYLSKVSENSYRLNTHGQTVEGTFIRKANGKNSFIPDGSDKAVFVAERNSQFALTGDRVRVTMMARREKHIKEAMVIEIIKRAHDEFVGRLKVERDFAFLISDSKIFVHDIFIPKRKLKGGKDGDKAVVRVTHWPSHDDKNIVGEVVDVLGKVGENNTEMHAILAQYGLPYKYPKTVEAAADKIDVRISAEEISRREDFRNVMTCTIDPYDAKDFDDALSIRQVGDDWEVGVHIADVSHYVKEGSIIDKEACKRATSVYLVDRTIPMLPERLCNFVCSLRPDEEKLCYSAVFVLDDEANIKTWRLVHTVIKSDRRFAYEEVQDILEKNGVKEGTGEPSPIRVHSLAEAKTSKPIDCGDAKATPQLVCGLLMLDKLAKKLRDKRFKNGAVKFEREELHFDVDEKGKPTRAFYKKSKDANKLIEEFMLLANRKVAESIGNVEKGRKAKTLPYRIHDRPDPIKLDNLSKFIARFGYRINTAGTKGQISRSLNKLMDDVSGKREQNVIEMVALRAMMKAKYSVHNIGHYGLAFDYYTHFTSPIRRFPDMMVHRLLTRYQEGMRSANKDHYEELCEHSSDMETLAQQAERESIKYKMVEFMGERLGNEYDAHISGITSYGIYAEIDENHCEGMISMHDLDDDYYDFDEKNYMLVGRRRHHKYQLGDPIRIMVARANIEKRQLDFVIAD
ncbi:MAG: RNB domain-containing ribonuclease [Prevotella sp.]|uniref:ribonuclease R family protein n=1 Tax=Prevotella sp. TaxID=59823 RepID=UPI002A34802F|nr:RNB domain-containing ribonuclease [Prevotella sp.]MDD7318474.1 RNB domain-containing ribonuclease [Prevotellaceae bacterium]MDY4020175.1 RNB domain-containing ribonuclease [Prevotella sp.]